MCLWHKEDTTEDDLVKFFGMSKTKRIIAIEAGWYDRLKKGTIYRYTFDFDGSKLEEPNAGYYTTNLTVKPLSIEKIDDLISVILHKGIELRVTPSLIPLKERILESTVNFSMIGMRNAVQE